MSPVNLMCMFLNRGRKAEKTTGTGSTCEPLCLQHRPNKKEKKKVCAASQSWLSDDGLYDVMVNSVVQNGLIQLHCKG